MFIAAVCAILLLSFGFTEKEVRHPLFRDHPLKGTIDISPTTTEYELNTLGVVTSIVIIIAAIVIVVRFVKEHWDN